MTSTTRVGDPRIQFAALGCAVAAMAALWWGWPDIPPWQGALVVLAAFAAPLAVLEAVALRVYARPTTGLDWASDRPWAPGRVAVKATGLAATVAAVGGIWWLFPEYRGGFYAPVFDAVRAVGPWAAVLAVPYLAVVDRRMVTPHDGYWHAGCVVLGRWGEVDRGILAQHALGCGVKAFFLPLMFTYLTNDVRLLLALDPALLTRFDTAHPVLVTTLYAIDLLVVTAGYVLSLRLLDTHVRSTEPTALGWVAAVLCYQPFWTPIGDLYFAYGVGRDWTWAFADHPVILRGWGTAILLAIAVYTWSSLSFGLRFSNLTHRGIVTFGPYRWTKHPAYLSKNLAWWLISVPFLAEGGWTEALRHCALLVALNGLYALRAWTEEQHLGRDPAYVAYARFVDAHGLWARVRRLFGAVGGRRDGDRDVQQAGSGDLADERRPGVVVG
ncbi:MAG: isoprenylcysteine carboxylmethyltransferase family protein [Myxococcota bacterium]